MAELDLRARAACQRLAQAEWEVAQLLSTMQLRGQWQELGCSSIVDYAERRLGMPADHMFSLLRLFADVERFPRAMEAWRAGEISRAKLREIVRVMTAESEQQWLEFARKHSCREVERQVVLRPRQVKASRQTGSTTAPTTTGAAPASGQFEVQAPRPGQPQEQAPQPGQAQIEQPELLQPASSDHNDKPQAPPTVQNTAAPEEPVTASTQLQSPANAEPSDSTQPGPTDASSYDQQHHGVPSPKMVRVELTFAADEYAVIEAAVDLLRAGGCGRRREVLFVEMAQRVLANADARTRRRHAVVVEKDAATGEVAYVTGRGYLPARPTEKGTAEHTNHDRAAVVHIAETTRGSNAASTAAENAASVDVITETTATRTLSKMLPPLRPLPTMFHQPTLLTKTQHLSQP